VRTTSTASSSLRSPASLGVPERPSEIRSALAALGVRPRRERGQSFLADPFVADAEAALVETCPGEPVLEIGGGLGVLTRALLRRERRPLTVVERDPRLARHLVAVFGDSIRVREEDARSTPLEGYRAVTGNLPFSVATPLVVRILEARIPRAVAMLQKEVGERLAARPGSKSYGRLSILAALYGEIELYRTVPSSAFEPVPEVEGVLVGVRGRVGPLPVPSAERFERTIRELFSARRKQLGKLLSKVAGSGDEARRLARGAEWPEDWARRRPEEIAPESYFRLAVAMGP
jgi:16S rRNA (adenine1518-N6/adenine1519-N6)-dimethyltransferase